MLAMYFVKWDTPTIVWKFKLGVTLKEVPTQGKYPIYYQLEVTFLPL